MKMGVLEGAYQTVAGVGDFAAGSTDEALGRQFDDTRGGGLAAGFGEELGSSRDSFLTGIGQAVGVVPRGTAQERQTAPGPGISDGSGPEWGSGMNAKLIAGGIAAVVILWLIRPLLQIGAGVSD